LVWDSHDVELVAAPLGSTASGVRDRTSYVLQENVTPSSFAAALVHASREQADRLVLYADEGAPLAARLEQWFRPAGEPSNTPSVEAREVEGATSEPAVPELMPVVLPGPVDAERLVDRLRGAGLEVVLEQGEWRGELLGLEVARIVRWPIETGGDGELHIEAGVGRFDRDAAAAMHQGESLDEGLERAIRIVSEHRYPGAPIHPLSVLARSRWMRSVAMAAPEMVGATELRPLESTFAADSVREERPAAALGRTSTGTPFLVVFGAGSSLDLVPVATDTREQHLPGAPLRVVLPPRDHLPVADELVTWATASGRGEVEVLEMEPPWAT
jgi:hypothetical protein